MPANESIEGQILNDTLSKIYENLGDEIKIQACSASRSDYFYGRKAKQWCLRRELHSAKILSAGCLLGVANCDNAKFRQNLRQKRKNYFIRFIQRQPYQKTIAVADLNALSQACYEYSCGLYETKFRPIILKS